MIPIEKEPKEFYVYFKAYENCMFCDKETDTWNLQTNKPICKDCSEKNEVSDIPKYDWE